MVKRSGPDIPVARINFWTSVDGHRLLIRAGEAWATDDPVVVGNPGKFESLRIHSSVGVEQESVRQELVPA